MQAAQPSASPRSRLQYHSASLPRDHRAGRVRPVRRQDLDHDPSTVLIVMGVLSASISAWRHRLRLYQQVPFCRFNAPEFPDPILRSREPSFEFPAVCIRFSCAVLGRWSHRFCCHGIISNDRSSSRPQFRPQVPECVLIEARIFSITPRAACVVIEVPVAGLQCRLHQNSMMNARVVQPVFFLSDSNSRAARVVFQTLDQCFQIPLTQLLPSPVACHPARFRVLVTR